MSTPLWLALCLVIGLAGYVVGRRGFLAAEDSTEPEAVAEAAGPEPTQASAPEPEIVEPVRFRSWKPFRKQRRVVEAKHRQQRARVEGQIAVEQEFIYGEQR